MLKMKPELVFRVELLQIHKLRFVFFFHEKSAYFAPNVPGLYSAVVQHVWRTIYRDADFFQVGEDVFFRIPCACGVRLFHGSSLGADFYVYSRVCVFVDRHDFITRQVVIGKLFAAGVNLVRLFRKLFASNHLILKLDVRQPVLQLGCVGSSDHLVSSNTRSL